MTDKVVYCVERSVPDLDMSTYIPCLVAVFSTEELAQTFKDSQMSKEELNITPFTVDDPLCMPKVVILERTWTPCNEEQAEGRFNRKKD